MPLLQMTMWLFLAVFAWLGLSGCVGAPVAQADETPQKGGVSARALYYDQAKMDSVPTQQPPSPQTQAPKKAPVAQQAPVAQPVLALRVTVKLLGEGGGSKEVKPSSVFRSGDRIRLAFTSNKQGYLYLATVGSSGTPAVLIPGKSGGLVSLQPGYTHEFPLATKVIKFDQQVGDEQIYAFLSEVPLDIIDFGNGKKLSIPSDSSPRARPEQGTTMASIAAVRSRDLLVEEDDQALYAAVTPERQKEKQPIVVKMTLTHRDVR